VGCGGGILIPILGLEVVSRCLSAGFGALFLKHEREKVVERVYPYL
jgi:hypothetical protein